MSVITEHKLMIDTFYTDFFLFMYLVSGVFESSSWEDDGKELRKYLPSPTEKRNVLL